jgi:hypothetical protein
MRYFVIILMSLMLFSCSSKTIEYNTLGKKKVTTKTSSDIFHEQQASAWKNYYEALENPPVIAVITPKDGPEIKIHSQVPPPVPVIRQHQNQYIKPVADVLKWTIGGVVIDRGLSAVVRGAGDTIVDNAGDGTVYVDRSDSIAKDSSASFSTSTDSSDRADHSDNSVVDNTDNSVVDSHDKTAEPTIVTQPEYNEPIIID